MYKTTIGIATALLGLAVIGSAEPQVSPPPPAATIQLNTDFLNDVMRSAMIFNGMVQNLNLNRALHESGVARDSGNPYYRPGKRTAAVIGAGAGVGLAVGGMTGSQKGAIVGAAVGGASALVIDQIVQHQAKARLGNPDAYHDSRPDYDGDYRDPHQFKQRAYPQQ